MNKKKFKKAPRWERKFFRKYFCSYWIEDGYKDGIYDIKCKVKLPIYIILFIPAHIIKMLMCMWDGGLKDFNIEKRSDPFVERASEDSLKRYYDDWRKHVK